ncbi:MAG: ATP-grasp domain-containing protein [Chloroflexi bacterium]|nr:ATP-grasp domain-containing protein [Chloroflexota bacterium]
MGAVRVLLLMRTRTYRAKAFLEAAARIGVDVTVATEREQPLSTLTPGATIALPFDNVHAAEAEVVQFSERYPVTAVVGVDDDTTVLAAQLAARLRLPHNSVDAVKAARYKDVMRLALSEAELPSPEFWLFATSDDPGTCAQAVSYPCVLKPLALAASRGVIRADNAEEFVSAFLTTRNIIEQSELAEDDPARTQLLVETFIPGREVALEGLLREGELTTLAIFDKPDPLDGPYFEETIYVTPSRLPAADQDAIRQTAARAAAALGLHTGPLHAELRLNGKGVWVVEVAARSIGGLCSSTLRFGEGTSLEQIILRQAAGLELGSVEREQRPAGVMMIPIPAAGRLVDVHGVSEAQGVQGIDEVTISIPCGEQVVPLPYATRYLGFIFAHGDTPAAVEAALRDAHSRLTFEIA